MPAAPRHGPAGRRLTLEEFDALSFVSIDPSAGHGHIEKRLGVLGINRRTVLRVHHFSVLPAVLVQCSLAAVVPWEIAERFCRQSPLEYRELPVDSPAFTVDLYTDQRIASGGPVLWFRTLVHEALRPEASAGAAAKA